MLASAWRVPLGTALVWFLAGSAVLGLGLWVGALRFRTLLRGDGLDLPLAALVRAYVVAAFFNMVLPGAILGDVYRVLDARRGTGEGARVLGLIVLERLLSLAALGGIALIVAPFIPASEAHPALGWLPLLAGVGFVAPSLAALAPPVNRWLRVQLGRFARVSERGVASARKALLAVEQSAASPGVVTWALVLSIVNQGLPVLAVMLLAVPLDADVSWTWFAVIVPFVTLVSLLPISFGGTGVREVLYVSLFGAVGMRSESALALSLSVLAMALVWAAVGLLVFAAGRGTHDPLAASTGLLEPRA